MRLLALVAVLALFACRKAADSPVLYSSPDAGLPVPIDAGPPGPTPPDAGPVDAGPDAHRTGGLGFGPFPSGPLVIYGSSQGLLEAPISASVDESENLWVVSHSALYLLQPGAKVFRRYTAQDGLHFGSGYTESPDITLVEGGAKGECFVGYYARETNSSLLKDAHMWSDPWAHMGKMDQVLLQPDGKLKVNRYDLRNSNDGHYYETRTIMSMVYDHFQHLGNLYVGSNHGVTRIIPAKYYPPPHLDVDPFNTFDERQWYADHVHPWVCIGGPCDGARVSTFGDWFGLTLAPDGRLWMGGLTNAGAIGFKDKLEDWVQSWQPVNPFVPAFEWPPVYLPARMGDPVNIRGVAVTHDGMAWFVSGGAEGWRSPHYGIAAWDGKRFTYFDPIALGAVEDNVLEVQALDDGRLLFGFAGSGLMVWEPGEKKARRITQREGLPGERTGRLVQDGTHDSPRL